MNALKIPKGGHSLILRNIFLYLKGIFFFLLRIFTFSPCPLHLELDELTVFLPVCADEAEIPSGQSAASVLLFPMQCPLSKDSKCRLPGRLRRWSWPQSQSHVTLNCFTSDHRTPPVLQAAVPCKVMVL